MAAPGTEGHDRGLLEQRSDALGPRGRAARAKPQLPVAAL